MNRENKFRFPAQAARSLGNIRTRTWLILGAVGKRLAGEAVTQIEQVAPGLKEQVGQWLPGLGEASPVSDVSGIDVGPVPRNPGLVRSHFAREGQALKVRYAGRAAFNAVLTQYVQRFAAANYAQEVLSATSEGEQHRFRRGQSGLLELRLKLSSP